MTIEGYELLQEFSTAGGGQSRWTFARKAARDYFLKEFLAPKYPLDGSPGSEETKQAKRQRCADFLHRHTSIQADLAKVTSHGGNLVVTADFFRSGTMFYKATVKIDAATVSIAELAAQGLRAKLLILLSVAHSLRILHGISLVHGDVKPSNVLFQRGPSGLTPKVIDFDSSFFARRPPPAAELVGDMVYYSPELLAYVTGKGAAEQIDLASDIFALGLLFTQYLAGVLPRWKRQKRHRYAAIAVLNGDQPNAAGMGLDKRLERLLGAMLHPSGAERPSVDKVYAALKYLQSKLDGDKITSATDDEFDRLLGTAPRSMLRGRLAPRGPLDGVHPG